MTTFAEACRWAAAEMEERIEGSRHMCVTLGWGFPEHLPRFERILIGLRIPLNGYWLEGLPLDVFRRSRVQLLRDIADADEAGAFGHIE